MKNRHKTKKIFFLSLVLSASLTNLSLFAKENVIDFRSNIDDSQRVIETVTKKIYGKNKAYSVGKGRRTKSIQKENYQAVVYEHYKLYFGENDKKKKRKKLSKKGVLEVDFYDGTILKNRKGKQFLASNDLTSSRYRGLSRGDRGIRRGSNSGVTDENKQDKIQKVFFEGYCRLKNNIKVDRFETYAYLDCDLNNGKKGVLTIRVIPDFVAGILVAEPMYLTISNGERNFKLPVEKGVVMNSSRTSINIASIVNDMRLKKYARAYISNSAEIVAEKAQEYLSQVEASRKEEKTNIIPGGNNQQDTIVKETNVQKPQAKDYIASATVQLVSEFFKAFGKIGMDDPDFTFYVKKGEILYVDFISTIPEGMRGIIFDKNNMIKQFNFDQKEYKREAETIIIKAEDFESAYQSSNKNSSRKRR